MKPIRSFLAVAALAACFALSVPAFAAPVSPEVAADLAKGYAAYTGGALLDGRVAAPAGAPRAVTAEVGGEEVVLAWAFDMAPQGWILVAGDDRMAPVVGFSAEGALGDALWDSVSPPYHFVRGMLLDQWEAAIGPVEPVAPAAPDVDSASDGGEAGRSAVAAANGRVWSKYLAASVVPKDDDGEPSLPASPPSSVADLRVAALLGDIAWSQSGSGENHYTPNGYVCGCVQTALGQIMYHHRWPQAGIGRISGTIRVSSGGSVSIQAATTRGGDGNGGPYRWDLMTPGPTSTSANPAQAEARGALLSDLGILNGANYSANGTGANQSESVITGPLKYANAVAWDPRMGRIEDSFCCDFDAGYPISAASSTHQVVFDGYGYEDGVLYFHVNLGWGPSYNGWYLKTDWRGHSLGSAIINIFPDKTGEIVSGRVLQPDGTPFVSGAVVTVRAANGSTIGTATSNDRGIWAVAGVPSSTTVSVTAAASGRSFGTVSVDVGRTDSASVTCGNRWGVDLVAYDASRGNVRGRVTSATGLPVAGIRIATGDGLHSATTDADGLYFFFPSAGWSGTVAPAPGQGALAATPASHDVPPLAAGDFAVCDFTVSSRIYVKEGATGSGSSWADATGSLPDALAAAGNDFEVWVAAGTYRPTSGTARGVPFSIPANVKVYGGFAGGETSVDDRDWIENRTVLSGEIGSASSRTDNSAVLVRGAPGALLDGFVIRDAYSSSSESASTFGLAAGAFAVVSSPANSSDYDPFTFFVDHCRITDNTHVCPIVSGGASLRGAIVDGNACTGAEFARGGRFSFCTVIGNSGAAFNSSAKDSYGLWTRFHNCYFSNPGFASSTVYSYHDKTSEIFSYNIHATSERNKIYEAATHDHSRKFEAVALSSDERTLYRPPTNSVAVNYSYTLGASGQGWATLSGATDFGGRPRKIGTACDCGAWELPVQTDTTPLGSLRLVTVGETAATLAWEFFGQPSGTLPTDVILNVGTNKNFYQSQSVVYNMKVASGISAATSATYELSGLLPDTDYLAKIRFMGDWTRGGRDWTTPLLSFRTGLGSAPFVASLTASGIGSDRATVRIPLVSVGAGSTYAVVRLQLSRTSDFAVLLEDREVPFDEPGSRDEVLSGLDSDTTYFVRAIALASNGLSYTTDFIDFSTVYVPWKKPVLATLEDGGHVPLAFGKDASNNPTFEVTIKNAAKDAYYTVYASDTVDGTYAAVTSAKAAADGLMTLSIPAPSSKPARFVRIGVGEGAVPAGTALP